MYGFLNRRDGIAVRHQRGSLTYAEFNRLLHLLAKWMSERGAEPRDRVAVVLPNSLEFLLCYYACLLNGSVIVPINERLTTAEVGMIVERARPRLLIASPDSLNRFQGRPPFEGLPVYPLDRIEEWLETGSNLAENGSDLIENGPDLAENGSDLAENGSDLMALDGAGSGVESPWPLDHPAVLFFTSGSTGLPKGALYSHRTLVDNERIFRQGFDITSEDHSVVCHCLAANFMFSQLSVPFLHVGGTVQIVDFGNVAQTLEAIDGGASFICVIPWFGMQLVEEARARGVENHSLRVCEVGGDRVPLSFHRGFQEEFGMLPREMLGMTECNVFTVNPAEEDRIRVGSVGLPLPECKIEVRAPDGRVLPPGEEGEIHAWTPGRMEAYFEDPVKTAETVTDGWVATGDAGYLDPDGYLWVSGRIKHIIICDGDNVHPAEVERAVAEHPMVEKVTVFGIPDDIRGETVAAAIVPVPGADSLTLAVIEEYLEPLLAETKIPKDLLLLDSLPETAGGKLDRRTLVRLTLAQREALEG